MAFNTMGAAQGIAGAVGNYGKSPSSGDSDTKKEPQHRKYGKVLGNTDDPGAPGMKRGGRVKKTKVYKLHKGERVLTKKQAKRYEKK